MDPAGVTEKDLSNTALDDIAMSIKHLVDDWDRRKKTGEIIAPAEVRAIARQLQTHVVELLSEINKRDGNGKPR
jgi:hypothetical protein